ncbi:MAG: hypothetical protein N0C90_23420, partial [Candidatus Thiodiazotropha endolucinida]|nr:hypothetical protein [Candidatus Thiodiazotropha taylori]MCW4264303.1 hypothetical protein [Candidatus Thiodiazotropha endolucinida]
MQTCHKRQYALFLFGAILLLAITQTALARDPALPPGSDFQTAIQGAHHREKRGVGVARWLMDGAKWFFKRTVLTYSRATRSWTSSAGLVYRQDPVHGNRVMHVLAHTVPNPNKPLHSVFNVDRKEVLGLVDEAWRSRDGPGTL